MTFIIIILSGLFYLIPGNAEILCRYTSDSGNRGLNRIYLDIINKRNLIYISGSFSLILLYAPFKVLRYLSYLLFIFSVLLYFHSIKRWHSYLT